jgi:hypothetical protein
MTEINEVRVDEFRSGFTYQSCGESWRSTGFYGSSHIGITFDDGIIPELIQRAARREDSRFNVSQKIDYESFIDLPHQSREFIGFKEFNEDFVDGNALVGRIIEKWAVLAVVSVAIDFGNRPFPVKRYFCCLESDDGNYDAMATLIEFFFDNEPENLTFDILGNKPQKIYQVYPLSSQDLKSLNLLNCDYSMFDGLRLIKPDLDMSKNNLLQMWKTCLSLVDGDRKKAAWAFNIDSVANLTDFTLIQAGTQEFFQRNYSTVSRQPAVSPPPPSGKMPTKQGASQSISAELVFNDFVKNGKLSKNQNQIKFVTTDIQRNKEEWERLAKENIDEVAIEFNSFSRIIRYYTLSSLIVPERAVDLFQQLLFSKNDIWNVFLQSAEYFQNIQNPPYFKNYIDKSIEEGVWLIINYIIEDKFQLPQIKIFFLFPLGELSSQKKFFAEEDNIWREGIFLSYQKFINPGQQQENKSSSFQRFCENLDNAEYRENNKKGYEKITQFFSQSSQNNSRYRKAFLFFYNLINVNTIFNDFVKNGELSQRNIEFIKKNIPKNNEQWKKLATKNKDEITKEYKKDSYIIRYYTLSALIVPEKAVDLFHKLLLSGDDIWKFFLKSAKTFKSFHTEKNHSYFKYSLEEGVWLIINNIIEEKFNLPKKRIFFFWPISELLFPKKFFAEKDNIWIKGIFLSYQKFITPGQQQENKSSSFQRFCDNLDNEQYRKKHEKGYKQITEIFSQSSQNVPQYKRAFSFFQGLIEEKLNRTPVKNVPKNIQNKAPLNNFGDRRQRNNTKQWLLKISIILTCSSAFSLIATIILALSQFPIEVVIVPFVIAIYLIVIIFFLFVIQGFIPD